MKKKKFGIISLLCLLCFALICGNVSFAAWTIPSNVPVTTTETLDGITASSKTVVCYNKSTGVKYTNLKKALDLASSGQKVYMTAGVSYTCSENLTIKSGVSLILPFDTNENEKSFTSSVEGRNNLLTMSGNADITVNSGGILTIGAVLGTKGIVKGYSEISLNQGSSITVHGTLNCYGKITESSPLNGNTSPNVGKYDNSFDSNRFVSIESDGKLATALASYDMPSGSYINTLNGNNICPTYVFDFHCLQTYLFCKYGSKMDAIGYVSTGLGDADATVGIIRPSSSSDRSMFYISSGNIGIEYCGAAKTILYLDGNANLGSLYISASGVTIDTSSMFIPIPYKYSIYIGGTFSTNSHNVKFLPGAYVEVLESGTIDINSKVAFYNSYSLSGYSSNESVSYNSYSKADSTCINNGTIILRSSGSLGGYIKTNDSTGTAKIKLDDVSSQNALAVTSNEGTGNTNIPTLIASGPFFDSASSTSMADSIFKAGEIVSSHNSVKCWDGDSFSANKVTINVSKLYKNNLYSYSLYTNSSASTSGQTIYAENINKMMAYSNFVIHGHYLRLVDTTCASISVNGSSYTSGTWIQIEGDITITITPSTAFKVAFSLGGSSGAGSQTFTIKYGPTSSLGTTYTSEGPSGELLAPSGYYFTIAPSSWGSNGYTATVKKTTYDSSGNGTTATLYSQQNKKWNGGKDNQVWRLDGDYSFAISGWSVSVCVAENTLITMADGSQKEIRNVNSGEMVKVFNFFNGTYDNVPAGAVVRHGEASENLVIRAEFDDGKILEMINMHGLYDYDEKKIVSFDNKHGEEYLGHRFMTYDNGVVNSARLISVTRNLRECEVWSIFTYEHLNAVTNGLLSTNNALPITELLTTLDDNFKYDESLSDLINLYGYCDYKEWADYLDYGTYCAFNFKYVNVYIGLGITTREELILWIDWFYELMGSGDVQ